MPIITGTLDADTLSGSAAGDDTFQFASGFGADTIADFQNNHDTIRFSRTLGVASAAGALALAVESGGDVTFTFAGGETLTVLDTTKAALADDIFV